jgi:hypothetical protein
VRQVASQYEAVDVRTIDVAVEVARFAALGTMSIPVILVNGHVAFTGVPSEHELRARLEAADPTRKGS